MSLRFLFFATQVFETLTVFGEYSRMYWINLFVVYSQAFKFLSSTLVLLTLSNLESDNAELSASSIDQTKWNSNLSAVSADIDHLCIQD